MVAATITPVATLTPSATPTATATPAWPVQNCPVLAVVVDGSLAEWAAVTPVTLNVTNAAEVIIAPDVRATWTPVPTSTPKAGTGTPTVTPAPTSTPRPTSTPAPAVTDLDGTFYCAHDGAGTLYLAGNVRDFYIKIPDSLPSNGDATEITLDMNADGFRMPRVDDHSVTVDPAGYVRDFIVYPFGATAVAIQYLTLPANYWSWRWEIAIPAAAHGRASLDTGDYIGLVWGYYDSWGNATWDYRLTSAKRKAVLQ
jgi:hypothetical protein